MVPRHGGWLPHKPHKIQDWVGKQIAKLPTVHRPGDLHPTVQELRKLVLNDSDLFMLFTQMLDEVPKKYVTDGGGVRPQIRKLDDLWGVLSEVIKVPPSWDTSAEIGTPINAVLDWPMGTKAGYAVFLRKDVNDKILDILKAWGEFLTTPESRSTLTSEENGWFTDVSLSSSHMRDFTYNYDCHPEQKFWGYESWDNFFTRRFKPGRRDVSEKYVNEESVVVSAAEATPFSVQRNVQEDSKFWLKGQPYNVKYMLKDPRYTQFIGGTVYQAFLSADSYHRWHAPVDGKIVDYKLVPGSYYSEPLLTGFFPDGPDPKPDGGACAGSQSYLSHVAARGIIWIEADGIIGLMCMVVIGMAEVSSIDLTMEKNKHFTKGTEIGMFHFGGSTHCLVFRPGLKVDFAFPEVIANDENSIQWRVNSKLATVSKETEVRTGK